jgi:hypothetical protein
MRVGGQRHAPAAIPPEKTPGTLCTGGWVDHRAGLDRYGKSRLHRDSIPDRPAHTESPYRLSYTGPQTSYIPHNFNHAATNQVTSVCD